MLPTCRLTWHKCDILDQYALDSNTLLCLVSFVHLRTCPQSLLRWQAFYLVRECQDMLDNVGKTNPQILSLRPSLKDILWTLGVFVDICGHIWNLQHVRKIGMSTRISVICPVGGHVSPRQMKLSCCASCSIKCQLWLTLVCGLTFGPCPWVGQ
jgi:hypothetical protein